MKKNFKNLKFIQEFIGPVLFLFIAGIIIILTQWTIVNKRDDSFSVNNPAPETYRALAEIRYEDKDAVERLRNIVAESVVGVTVKGVSAKSRLQRRLEILTSVTSSNSNSNPELTTNQGQNLLTNLPKGLLNAISKIDEADRVLLLNNTWIAGSAYIERLEKLDGAGKAGNENLNSVATSILWEEIRKLSLSPENSNLIYQILSSFGNLNLRVDDELTELARQAAIDDIPAIERKLEPGNVIVYKGEMITEQIAALLRLQGYTEDVFPTLEIGIVIFFVLMIPLWLNIFWHGAGDKRPTWWCVVFVIITAWVFESFSAHIDIKGAGVLAAVTFSYLCISDYFAFCTAITATTSGAFLVTNQSISDFILLLVISIIASTAGFYLLRNLESRAQVTRRAFAMSFILTASRMFLRWAQGPELVQDSFRLFIPLGEFWQQAGLFFIFEALSTHIILITIPFIEDYIGALSVLSLREISHPSNPLLRDLQRHAPGTYQHSLTIATLIEAVGIEMGMDVNLLRAGAYYHDIGKLRKPRFFVENQKGGFNAHDEMSPMLSSMTIISHVKDGLELALEAKLPKRIRDFIAEHHGTTCTRYFYNKAVAMGENVEWSAFCYPGPKPQSKETALLMIVDSVEAAVRAANIRELQAEEPRPNRGKVKTLNAIEKIVAQVVSSKINEGQFDEVNLTQKDLTRIKGTLNSVLMAMYHTRKVKKIEKIKK